MPPACDIAAIIAHGDGAAARSNSFQPGATLLKQVRATHPLRIALQYFCHDFATHL
jgi:hypothetical protein